MKPLKGRRVLDFSKVLAGPLCAQWLGDLGADVVKIEPCALGDDTRAWPPLVDGVSAMFLAVNRNKRSLALDLKAPEARDVLDRLTRTADIVIQGFGGGAAERLGIDYPTLRAVNPELIYCDVSGFGREGPMAADPGYDAVLQAYGALLSTMGTPEGELVRASFSPIDQGTGMHAVSGILAALLHRQATGEGALVEVSLLDTALGFMGYMISNHLVAGDVPTPLGSGHASLCPFQVFETADDPVLLGIGNDAQWAKFCRAADRPDWLSDPRRATNVERVRRRAETVRAVQEVMSGRTAGEWTAALMGAGAPCVRVNDLPQVLAEPQVAARRILVSDSHPVLGEITNVGFPVSFDKAARRSAGAPPLHGQHSADILGELGYARSEIADWCARGVTRQAAPEA